MKSIEAGVTLSGRLISEEIGRGGFSRVFRAEPVGGGEAVAIKVAVRPELVNALRSEGAVLRRLRSPRFVEIKEEHLEDDPPYFVLELCPGGDLRKVLEKAPGKRLAPADAERKIEAILEGMAFAHDEGYVHGDLKPENVLLDAKGECKIADLGLSRAHRKQLVLGAAGVEGSLSTGDGKLRGTFDYLAPELRAGHDLSPSSDVYALGVFLYEMLTGKRPLGVFQLPRAALARDDVGDVPEYLDRICGRALAHDTRERYPDAGLMLADLRAREKGIPLAAVEVDASRGPRTVLVKPVSDAAFVSQIYLPVLVPGAIFVGAVLIARSLPLASLPVELAEHAGLALAPLAAAAWATRRLARRLPEGEA